MPTSPVVMDQLLFTTVSHNRRTFIPIAAKPGDPEAFVIPSAPSDRVHQVRVRSKSYRLNDIDDANGLATELGVTEALGVAQITSIGADICTVPMMATTTTSTVTVRLSKRAPSSE